MGFAILLITMCGIPAYLEEVRKRGGIALVAYDLIDVEAIL